MQVTFNQDEAYFIQTAVDNSLRISHSLKTMQIGLLELNVMNLPEIATWVSNTSAVTKHRVLETRLVDPGLKLNSST